jgi:phytoene dehydrogenase-like protein
MDTGAKKVIVIGAGLSGLTCAYLLTQAGCLVTVVESTDAVGGVMQTRIVADFLCGPSFDTPRFSTGSSAGSRSRTGDRRTPAAALHLLPRPAASYPMNPAALLSTSLLTTGQR